jgi:adenine-specific DNA-methyltransferase
MEKMRMHSPNLTQENIARIAELFPGCVTETEDSDGQLKLAVDFDQLRQELSESIVEGTKERYRLDWPGKRRALLTANAPIAKTLRPCREESVDFDATQNLFIEGDNLDALKLLKEAYSGKVKMIYIDPPYNTGNDFIYRDNFAENTDEFLKRSNQKDDEGNQLVANSESNGKFHSDWLSMIYSRLKLSRYLLRDDGVIFISIDDGEYANLKSICTEIFGERNFLGTIVWKKKTNGNNMGYIPPVHDYILCFAKSAGDSCILGFPLTEEYVNKTYTNPDNDERGPWTTSDLSANHEGPLFPIVNPLTGKEYYPAEGRYWVFNEIEVNKRIKDGRIIFGKTGTAGPIQKKFLSQRESSRTKPESWWDKHGLNEDGTEEIGSLFAPKVFDHPKPTTLLAKLIEIASAGEDILLDFFAGSGSFAHALFIQSAKDGLNRRFVCVQVPEKCDEKSVAFNKCGLVTIADLAKERIRRAGKNILEGECHSAWNKDIGFRVLKVDSSNMLSVYLAPDSTEQIRLKVSSENIKSDRGSEDLLFQEILDIWEGPSLPIRRQLIKGKTVFFVNEPPHDLIACFDAGVNEELAKELAQFQPIRVVFRDNGFISDAVKINVDQIFRQMSPGTEVKSI